MGTRSCVWEVTRRQVGWNVEAAAKTFQKYGILSKKHWTTYF